MRLWTYEMPQDRMDRYAPLQLQALVALPGAEHVL